MSLVDIGQRCLEDKHIERLDIIKTLQDGEITAKIRGCPCGVLHIVTLHYDGKSYEDRHEKRTR